MSFPSYRYSNNDFSAIRQIFEIWTYNWLQYFQGVVLSTKIVDTFSVNFWNFDGKSKNLWNPVQRIMVGVPRSWEKMGTRDRLDLMHKTSELIFTKKK